MLWITIIVETFHIATSSSRTSWSTTEAGTRRPRLLIMASQRRLRTQIKSCVHSAVRPPSCRRSSATTRSILVRLPTIGRQVLYYIRFCSVLNLSRARRSRSYSDASIVAKLISRRANIRTLGTKIIATEKSVTTFQTRPPRAVRETQRPSRICQWRSEAHSLSVTCWRCSSTSARLQTTRDGFLMASATVTTLNRSTTWLIRVETRRLPTCKIRWTCRISTTSDSNRHCTTRSTARSTTTHCRHVSLSKTCCKSTTRSVSRPHRYSKSTTTGSHSMMQLFSEKT